MAREPPYLGNPLDGQNNFMVFSAAGPYGASRAIWPAHEENGPSRVLSMTSRWKGDPCRTEPEYGRKLFLARHFWGHLLIE